MAIHELTCDELLLLTAPHHRLALRLYTAEINALLARLDVTPDKQSPAYAARHDELGQLLTLRKVHQGRLDELEAETSTVPTLAPLPAPFSVLDQYEQNERTLAFA